MHEKQTEEKMVTFSFCVPVMAYKIRFLWKVELLVNSLTTNCARTHFKAV